MSPLTQAPRVLVFDSGVGGLSILNEIRQRLPACEFIYASDNEAFPYGSKGEDELINRVTHVLQKLLQDFTVDILVIACNTASTLALPHIRSHFSQPIVGVVPAIKPAAARSTTKVIGLLATPATVVRPYTKELIQQHANHCTVISVGSSELVVMAEKKLRGETISALQLAQALAPFLEHSQASQLDTIVLACTHFPLLRQELLEVLPAHIDLIDSGAAIARRVEFLLSEHFGMLPNELLVSAPVTTHKAVFTQPTRAVEQLRTPLKLFGITDIHYVHLEKQ